MLDGRPALSQERHASLEPTSWHPLITLMESPDDVIDVMEDHEQPVECDRGHQHWGRYGAAGALLRHVGASGTPRYLLMKRSPYVDAGETWSVPGGAMAAHESPVAAAVREATEEMGPFPASNMIHAHTNDHGGWAYHTVTGDAPSPFEPRMDDENAEHGWFTPAEVDELPLHPGFRESWDALRPNESPGGPGLSRGASHSLTEFTSDWKFGRSTTSLQDPHNVPQARTAVKERPPNLHQAWGQHRCSNCVAFRHKGTSMNEQGACAMFDGYEVEKTEVCDDWEAKKHSRIAGEAEVLDHLSLSSIAHNLHYQYEKDPHMDPEQYAQRLLKLVGYPVDELTTKAAIQGWQSLYPGDKLLQSTPDPGAIEVATTPTQSWGYGTVSGLGEWMQHRWPAETMDPTHRCPNCGQGLLSRGRGWSGITDEGEPLPATPGAWHCPTCETNLGTSENLPIDLGARIGKAKPLYHWTDAHDLERWMDPSHTGPGETYLTEHGDPPGAGEWNADVPMPEHPVRLTVDPTKLDPKFFDPQYEGWLGNHLYMGVVPPDAIVDLKSFAKPDDWDSLGDSDHTNVDPAPAEHWGDPQYHELQIGNDFRGSP